ncbi:MAG: DegT/DnrJ/EryC1/StrS family aminotransferase [Phycisphaerae bacterium]|nr:DegT/DnrJ/EryC1/StrS family aminotransferase [Phycisphaerae bacterium]
MKVPLLDLKSQYAALRGEILPALEAVLESQQLIGGPAVARLEAAVAAYCGCAYGVGVSSGTDALLCALMGLDIGPGAEVITTPYTFFATAGSIMRAGARPVFVDIDLATFNIDPDRISAAVTSRTRAIMPVHLFGQMAEMDPIMAVADRHGLAVIEDAAQSIGARYKGRPSGSIGTVGALSFFPTKNLGGAGDGGMMVTANASLAHRLAILRNHGMEPKYHYQWIGGNFRLDTLQAAYLLVKLQHLDEWSARRRANGDLYRQRLAGCDEIICPHISPANQTIFNQFVIRSPQRDGLKAHLAAHGIGTEIYYPLSLHEQPCFKSLGYRRGDFPNSELAAAQALALPIYPELSAQQIHYVADTILAFFS